MKRFNAILANDKFINVEADKMLVDKDNNMLMVYKGEKIVACADMSIILSAHISEQGG